MRRIGKDCLWQNSGFTLVEVLATLLVLGAGLLGFLGVALHLSQDAQESAIRVQAQCLAMDTIERINGNPTALTVFSSPSSGVTGKCTVTTPCTDPRQMALADLSDLHQLAATTMPRGDIAVLENCGDGMPLSCVLVSWFGTPPTLAACQNKPVENSGSSDKKTASAKHCLVMHFWAQR